MQSIIETKRAKQSFANNQIVDHDQMLAGVEDVSATLNGFIYFCPITPLEIKKHYPHELKLMIERLNSVLDLLRRT
jgi:hypothetical protein